MPFIETSKRKYYSFSQKKKILNELDSGDITHSELARKHSIHPMTLYKWKRNMGQKENTESHKLRHSEMLEEYQNLKKENDMLKKALADMALEKQILKIANDIYQEESSKKKLTLPKKFSGK